MSKVAREVATEEIQSWLDAKKVSEKKREEYASQIDTMVEAVCEGNLTLDSSSKDLTQSLKFPIAGEGSTINTLKFKARVKIEAIRVQLASVKTTDPIAMQLGYLAALTGTPRGILKELDTDDYSTATAILVFFL